MGNAIGREETGADYGRDGDDDDDHDGDDSVRSNGDVVPGDNHAPVRYRGGREGLIPSALPTGSRSPVLISPQMAENKDAFLPKSSSYDEQFLREIPISPLQGSDGPPFLRQTRQSDSEDHKDPEKGIPTIITWNYGGSDVLVEGSWDNWTSRKRMQRSGKDCSVLLVLPSGIYHYKFIIDGEYRHIPELPHITDEKGLTCNLLDVHGFVPELPESIAEFEAPPSPESSYGQMPSSDEDFAKEPSAVPPQLHLTVLGPESLEEPPVPLSRPQHVVLNHLLLEKGRSSQSVVALGLTHRFESKYVTVVLYKPMKR